MSLVSATVPMTVVFSDGSELVFDVAKSDLAAAASKMYGVYNARRVSYHDRHQYLVSKQDPRHTDAIPYVKGF